MNHADLVGYLIGVVMLGIKPGPTVSSVMAYSFYRGAQKAPELILGILAANILLIVVSALLRSLGFDLTPGQNVVFSAIGSLSLFAVGIRLLFRSFGSSTASKAADRVKEDNSGFRYGFLLHVSNPNTIVFFTSVFLSIVPLDANFLRNVFVLGSFALIVDAIILSTYASAVWVTGRIVFASTSSVIGTLVSRTPIVASALLIFVSSRRLFLIAPATLRLVHDFFYR